MKMRRGYADGPFGQIHFQDGGRGRPLVLLHQAVMSSEQFANVVGPLAAHGLRPIAIDMPGFGLSDPTDFVPAIADYAQAVTPVLDALGLDQAVVAGHHTGALVATETAALFAERVRAVILAGPFVVSDAARQALIDDIVPREKAFAALPGAAHMRVLAEARERHAGETISTARISDYVVQAMMARGAYWYGHNAAFAYRQEPSLLSLRQPGLILTNTGDMIYEAALAAHALRPDFAFTALVGGGIDIVDQQPQAWADACAAFIDSLD